MTYDGNQDILTYFIGDGVGVGVGVGAGFPCLLVSEQQQLPVVRKTFSCPGGPEPVGFLVEISGVSAGY